MSQTTFDRLGLPAELVAALAAQRITEPFAIQGLTLPDALAGHDILGRAPTGSGKTLAFGLPALARLAATDKAAKRRPRGLILSPTRELADQISRELEALADAVGRRVLAVYGGAALSRQVKALGRGVDLLVATPGRLLDLIDQGQVGLEQVEIAVVDEADRMADMGFLPDVRRLLDQTADDRQTLLFSATLDGDVQELIDRYQHDPVLHEIGDPEPDLSQVEHRFIEVAKNRRLGVAAELISDAGSTVVFVRTRHGVDRLARQLRDWGVKAGYIHGGRTQSQRTRALELFTDGKVDALVATDVAARGIHVDGVACVLHYDPPAETKDYVHRSGRTARAGAEGTVISLLDPSQVKESRKMQRQLNIEAEVEPPPTLTRQPSKPAREPASGGGGTSKTSGRSKPKKASGKSSPGKSSSAKNSAGKSSSERSSTAKSASKRSSSNRSSSSDKASAGGASTRPAKRSGSGQTSSKKHGERTSRAGGDAGTSGSSKSGSSKPGSSRSGSAKSGPGKKAAKATGSNRRATKRSGRPRPPNRKGVARSKRRS